MSSHLRIFQWLGAAAMNRPSEGYYWAPSSKMLNPQDEEDYLDGFPEGIVEVLPNTKGFVSFKYINDAGQEMARTNFYKFVPIDFTFESPFVQTVAEFVAGDCEEEDRVCHWIHRIAMPVNLYSEEIPLANWGKTPTMSALEAAFGGDSVRLAEFTQGPDSESNITPLILAGLGFAIGGPLGAFAGLAIGSFAGGQKESSQTLFDPRNQPMTRG